MGRLKYLLDANVLSEPTKALPDPRVCQKIIAAQTTIATASIVIDELGFGVSLLPPSKKRTLLESWLVSVMVELPVLSFDVDAARWHGRERARLRQAPCRDAQVSPEAGCRKRPGLTPSYCDGLIAAIAHVNGLVLVTRNTHDFRCFDALQVENWFEGHL